MKDKKSDRASGSRRLRAAWAFKEDRNQTRYSRRLSGGQFTLKGYNQTGLTQGHKEATRTFKKARNQTGHLRRLNGG